MSNAPLTKRQQQLYDFIVAYLRAQRRPPTFREMMKHLGILSPQGVRGHLLALKKKGFLIHRPGEARGWLPPASRTKCRCPHCGEVYEHTEELG